MKFPEHLVEVGYLGRPHGVNGEIKFYTAILAKSDIVRVAFFWIKIKGEWQRLTLTGVRAGGEALLVSFQEYPVREDVAQLANCAVGIPRDVLPKLPEGEYYWSDLIGLTVYNQNGFNFGVIQQLMATGSNDVLVVQGNEQRHLIPYISSVVQEVDLKAQRMVIAWEE